ncbi:MAG: hypothetical protein P9L99_15735 [Candidatus Lernaella stagnicola]|nr:hypothetical protein [Candidatus Lernaella stagnicola]
MKKFLLSLIIVFSLVIALSLIACEENGYLREKPDNRITQDDGNQDAKNKDGDLTCANSDLRVEDCYDACSCCYLGQEDNNADCVEDCSFLLMRQYQEDHELSKADYERYNWCILGCVSMCGAREKDDTCFDECKVYLGL